MENCFSATARFFVLLSLFLCMLQGKSAAQKIEWLTEEKTVSLRGLSVVTDQVIWVCGSGGTVARSIDGGIHWEWMTVKGFEQTDFRDIEAFDEQTAVLMGISRPAYLLRTEDGGQHWEIVYQDTAQGVFLDALAFSGTRGYAVGDPLEGHPYLYMAETKDAGRTWKKMITDTGYLFLEKGEALFASSGTNVVVFSPEKKNSATYTVLTVTGGTFSSLLYSGSAQKIPLPIRQGRSSTGANSLAAWNKRQLVVCGGDFANDKDTTANCFWSNDGGLHWKRPKIPPQGYRSCVAYVHSSTLIACGTSGVDVSVDRGRTWRLISPVGFHVCQKAKHGKAVFLAGPKGRIARLNF